MIGDRDDCHDDDHDEDEGMLVMIMMSALNEHLLTLSWSLIQ